MSEKTLYVKTPLSINVEYDRQNDILYVYFNREEEATEEILDENGESIMGYNGEKLVYIMILKFSEKINGYII